MSDPLLRELDHYVVLEPGGGETILTAAETLDWLGERLAAMSEPPADLACLPAARSRAQRLLETACELEIAPGLTIRWFAVRLEPPARSAPPGC
ncbi:MAG: chlororespiratory reduction protein 7 [Cyanobium sp.]